MQKLDGKACLIFNLIHPTLDKSNPQYALLYTHTHTLSACSYKYIHTQVHT